MNNRSLTLIELLIALTIFAIVAVAIYSVFSTGIISWRRGEISISFFHELRLSLDRISQEIRNQNSYNGLKLVGKADELYFISFVPFPEEGKSEYHRLARIRYFLEDEGTNNLSLSREREWVPSMEGTTETDKMRLIRHIKSFDFQYGREEIKENETSLSWQADWEDKEKVPVAIKINIEVKVDGEPKKLSRVIYLPQGEDL